MKIYSIIVYDIATMNVSYADYEEYNGPISQAKGGVSIPPPKDPEEAPTVEDPEIVAARRAEQDRLRRLKGRQATILTGPQGTSTVPELRRKSLLGE